MRTIQARAAEAAAEQIERLLGNSTDEAEESDLSLLLMADDELREVDLEDAYLAMAGDNAVGEGDLVRSVQLEALESVAGGFAKREGSA